MVTFMAVNKDALLLQLRGFVGQPEAQAAYATELLAPRHGLQVVRAALHVLVARAYPPALPALVRLYEHYAAQGVVRDPGTYVRSEILRAMRPLATLAQLPLLEAALITYEFPPPDRLEDCAQLRSAALVTLAQLDDVRSKYHATRLLADPFTDKMSGQPALIAVTVLAAQGELLPLYYYAMQEITRMQPEVVGECLRHLRDMPSGALPPLLAHYAECEQPVILVGLADLLLAHPAREVGIEFIAQLLARAKDLDLYRYLAAVLFAAPDARLRTLLLEQARFEQAATKVEILLETLETGDDNATAELTAMLRSRHAHQRAQKRRANGGR